MDESKRLLTIEEAALFLGVSKTSLRRWTKDGLLSCHRIGVRGERRFDQNMLEEFLQRGGSGLMPVDSNILQGAEGVLPRHSKGGPHKHICLYFRNPGEQWEAFRGYFLDHYRANLPTTYLYHASSREHLIQCVANEGIDPQYAINRGLLRLVSAQESYLRQGAFSADFMISFMRLILSRMHADGFSKHLITGEMDWYFTNILGYEEMHAYERRLNKLLDDAPEVTIVCQYDVTRFDGEGVLDACCTHPLVHLDGRLRSGFFG